MCFPLFLGGDVLQKSFSDSFTYFSPQGVTMGLEGFTYIDPIGFYTPEI